MKYYSLIRRTIINKMPFKLPLLYRILIKLGLYSHDEREKLYKRIEVINTDISTQEDLIALYNKARNANGPSLEYIYSQIESIKNRDIAGEAASCCMCDTSCSKTCFSMCSGISARQGDQC
jgi:hypothetical protein